MRNGTLLSDAFRQQGIFPKMYVTSVMAGEKSGSLAEVLDRYITYQKLSLAVRKKVMVSLMYPCVLIVLVVAADGLPGDLRGADLRQPLQQHAGEAAGHDGVPDRGRARRRRNTSCSSRRALVGGIFLFRWWARKDSAREKIDRVKLQHCRCSARSG